jgi:hypothetical protein
VEEKETIKEPSIMDTIKQKKKERKDIKMNSSYNCACCVNHQDREGNPIPCPGHVVSIAPFQEQEKEVDRFQELYFQKCHEVKKLEGQLKTKDSLIKTLKVLLKKVM